MNISKLGTLRAAIEADTGGLHSSISGAKADFKSFGEKVPGYVKPVSLALLGMGTATVTALSALVLSAGKMGDELDKMSLRTGVAVEDLSGLSYAAKISGTDMTAMETSIRFLNRRMDESSKGIGIAKEAFEKLGVSITDSEGKMRPSIDVMKEVADGIVRLESESEKGATAMDIFGARSGPQILPLLKQGSAGIEELTDKAAELGLIISDKAAKASAEFTDRLTEVKDTAKMAGFELGQTLLPAITDLLEKATGLVGKFSKLDEGTQRMVGWGTAGGASLAIITGGAGLLLTQLPKMAKGWSLLSATAVPQIAAVGAALVALTWATNETYNAYVKWRDGIQTAEEQLEGWVKATIPAVKANKMLRKELADLKDRGFDPATASIGSLNIDIDDLNKLLNSNIHETTLAVTVVNSLSKGIKRTQDRIKKFRGEEDKATESIFESIEATRQKTTEINRSKYAVTGFSEEQEKSFAKVSFLETDQTQKRAHEIGKRAVLDDAYVEKIRRNHVRRLASAGDTLNKESGLIQEHFDWSVQAAEIRSQKEIRIRKDQYAEELQARESLELAIDHIDERAFLMEQKDDERQLELKNLSYRMAVEAEEKSVRDRSELLKTFLDSATANVKAEMDLQSGSYEESRALIQRVYDDYAPFVEKFNLKAVELERWRADQIQAIDKQLSKTRIKELDDYYVSYDEKVRSHEELFGGAMSGLLRGRSIYEGMDPEYRQRLNYGLAQQVFFPEEASSSQERQGSPAPVIESYTPGGGRGAGEIHIHIQNVYGGDEAWANEFAEDIGRRIREQGYQQ